MSGDSPEEVGPYLVYEQLGAGGMATVHRAEQRGIAGFRRVVALKRLHENVAADPELLRSFVHEARLASYLKHTNVAQTFDLGKVGETYFIAMEYVPGPTLAQLMRQCAQAAGPIPLGIVLSILIQICDALDHAHNLCDDFGRSLGIIHRDVSPSNVIVSSSGTVKLIDFGIAKAANSDVRTQTGMIKGKFGYIAPEYLTGQLDPRGDLFGVGVISHELIAGRPLFLGRNDFDTLSRVREMPIPRPSEVNAAVTSDLDDIVMTALQRDPELRWQSAAAMRTALHNAMRELGYVIGTQQVSDWVEWAFSQDSRSDNTDLRRAIAALDEPSVLVERPSGIPAVPAFATTSPELPPPGAAPYPAQLPTSPGFTSPPRRSRQSPAVAPPGFPPPYVEPATPLTPLPSELETPLPGDGPGWSSRSGFDAPTVLPQSAFEALAPLAGFETPVPAPSAVPANFETPLPAPPPRAPRGLSSPADAGSRPARAGQDAELPSWAARSGAEVPGRSARSGQGAEVPGRSARSGQGPEVPGRSARAEQDAEGSAWAARSGQDAEVPGQYVGRAGQEEASGRSARRGGQGAEVPAWAARSGQDAEAPGRLVRAGQGAPGGPNLLARPAYGDPSAAPAMLPPSAFADSLQPPSGFPESSEAPARLPSAAFAAASEAPAVLPPETLPPETLPSEMLTPPAFAPEAPSPAYAPRARSAFAAPPPAYAPAALPPETLPPETLPPAAFAAEAPSPAYAPRARSAFAAPPPAYAPAALPPETLTPSAFAPDRLSASTFISEPSSTDTVLPTLALPNAAATLPDMPAMSPSATLPDMPAMPFTPAPAPIDPAAKLAAAKLAPAPTSVSPPKLVSAPGGRSKPSSAPPAAAARDKPPSVPPSVRAKAASIPPPPPREKPLSVPPLPGARAKAASIPPPPPTAKPPTVPPPLGAKPPAAKPPTAPPAPSAKPSTVPPPPLREKPSSVPPPPPGMRAKPPSAPMAVPAAPSGRLSASNLRPSESDSLGATDPHLPRFSSPDDTGPAPRDSFVTTDPVLRPTGPLDGFDPQLARGDLAGRSLGDGRSELDAIEPVVREPDPVEAGRRRRSSFPPAAPLSDSAETPNGPLPVADPPRRSLTEIAGLRRAAAGAPPPAMPPASAAIAPLPKGKPSTSFAAANPNATDGIEIAPAKSKDKPSKDKPSKADAKLSKSEAAAAAKASKAAAAAAKESKAAAAAAAKASKVDAAAAAKASKAAAAAAAKASKAAAKAPTPSKAAAQAAQLAPHSDPSSDEEPRSGGRWWLVLLLLFLAAAAAAAAAYYLGYAFNL